MSTKKIKILHIIYQLNTGGLENGLVNLINQLPSDQFEHTVLSLSYSTDFKYRIIQPSCKVIDLNKEPGPLFWYFSKILKIIKQQKPDIVHTRNLSSVECQMVAWFAGVPVRIHGEHGREPNDALGNNKKNQLIRKITSPFVQKYIALSKELETYLIQKIKVAPERITQIYNGVDYMKFIPQPQSKIKSSNSTGINIITVGRLQAVKNFQILLEAIAKLNQSGYQNIKLRIVGDGVERDNLQHFAETLKIAPLTEFLGDRQDVPDLLQKSDIFVLPSLIEGISNTILEAMSCGLPIIASHVGGNPELIIDNQTGYLFQTENVFELASAIEKYIKNRSMISQHGMNSRKRIEEQFSLELMVAQYQSTYHQLIKDKNHQCVA